MYVIFIYNALQTTLLFGSSVPALICSPAVLSLLVLSEEITLLFGSSVPGSDDLRKVAPVQLNFEIIYIIWYNIISHKIPFVLLFFRPSII